MKKIKKMFITGLILLLPIGITIYFIFISVRFLDGFIGIPLEALIKVRIPGLGIIIALILIFITGFISNNYLGKKIAHFIETFLSKIPIIRTIYSPVKDIIKTLMRDDDTSFLKVVMVEFPMEKSYSIGFITNEHINLDGEIYNSVFIPTTPNPTSGFLIYRKTHQLKVLD
ncbi:MAG: DUF502 domain-containing protein, partial [Clostridia bacterium]